MDKKLFLYGIWLMLTVACGKDDDGKDFRLEGEWETHFSPFPIAVLHGSVGFGDGESYYCGLGSDPEMPTNLLCRFKPGAGWTVMEKFPGKQREGAVGFVLGKKIYVGLGLYQAEALKDFWVYDTQTGEWEELQTEFPGEGRWGAVAFVSNGKAYVGTGARDDKLAGTTLCGDFYAFSPESGWNQAEGLTVNARKDATAFEADGNIYLCFGQGKESTCRDVYRLAEDELSWEAMKSLSPDQFPEIPEKISSFVLNRKGLDYAFVYDTKRGEGYKYVPREDRWERSDDLPKADFYFTVSHTLYRVDGIQTFRLIEE